MGKMDQSEIMQSRMQEVLGIIHKEYTQDISLDYLAQKVYLSPCYLSMLFSKYIGVSLLAYLNSYRMEQAIVLLLETDTKVKDICQMVGYRNLPYFCTCFKNRFQMTPAQYRQSYGSPAQAMLPAV